MIDLLQNWWTYLPALLEGLLVSLKIAGVSLAFGLPVGLLLSLVSLSTRSWARGVTRVVVEIGRGIPSLVALQLIYFGLPQVHLVFDAFTASVLTFSIATAAYTSEIFRAGLMAVPRGQREAALALGLNYAKTNALIVVPQALRIVIGPVLGYSISIFQATSLTIAVAVPELLFQAYQIGSRTFEYLSVLVLAGLVYAVIAMPSAAIVRRIETRMSRKLA
jgi:polar amino acid transport system permease protein